MIDITTLQNEVLESLKTASSYGIDQQHGQAMVQAITAQNQILFALLEELQGLRNDLKNRTG